LWLVLLGNINPAVDAKDPPFLDRILDAAPTPTIPLLPVNDDARIIPSVALENQYVQLS
jgi:hypothetical protein